MENTTPNRQQNQIKFTETFDSSTHEVKQNRFHVDKILYKGIKQNDVAKIIDVSKDGGTFQENQFSQLKEIQNVFVQMRKKYDEVKISSKKCQIESQKHRQTIENLKIQQKKLQNILENTRTECSKVEEADKQMTDVVQARLYERDICLQMLQTLKHDILIMKKRTFDKEIDLRKEGSKLKSLKTEQFTKTKLSYRCKGMLQSIEKTVSHHNQERKTKMNSFYDILNKKYEKISNQEQREKDIEEVMMRAMSQKLQEEKEWINICYVNIFLKKFLKNQMERIALKNQVSQTAFHKIKMATDITDSRDFIERFLNRQKNYGALLQSISAKENILENLNAQKIKLEEKNILLIRQCEELMDLRSQTKFDEEKLLKQMNIADEQCKSIEAKKNHLFEWSLKFLCAFREQKKDNLRCSYSRTELINIFTNTLLSIKQFLEKIQTDEASLKNNQKSTLFLQQPFVPSNFVFSQEMSLRNNRIKTLSTFEEGKDRQDKEQDYDDTSQTNYLQYNRKIVKKNQYSRRFRIKTKQN